MGSKLRFTISQHTIGNSPHYDFMLEDIEKLKVWKVNSIDFSQSRSAVASFDHRKIYLDFEGELTNNRGRIKIWDSGLYKVVSWQENEKIVDLQGKKILGVVKLKLKSESAKEGSIWEITKEQ
jgi:bifunctional non-homologous end joining protein LigD